MNTWAEGGNERLWTPACTQKDDMSRRIAQIFATILLGFAPLLAQYHQRDVSGVVTDMRGNPLPKVAVQIENTGNLSVRSYITGKDGRFYFNNLNDDVDFTLKAKYRNWWSKTKTLSKFEEKRHPEIDLVIPVD